MEKLNLHFARSQWLSSLSHHLVFDCYPKTYQKQLENYCLLLGYLCFGFVQPMIVSQDDSIHYLMMIRVLPHVWHWRRFVMLLLHFHDLLNIYDNGIQVFFLVQGEWLNSLLLSFNWSVVDEEFQILIDFQSYLVYYLWKRYCLFLSLLELKFLI